MVQLVGLQIKKLVHKFYKRNICNLLFILRKPFDPSKSVFFSFNRQQQISEKIAFLILFLGFSKSLLKL